VSFPFEFALFGLTLLGVAVFHRHTLAVALAGLAAITAYKLAFGDFHGMPGAWGLRWHLEEEWVVLANLFALLVGFALLARHFEQSHLPLLLPRVLPDDWKGGLVLLALVFVLSAFLDNIAAAMIGATVAAAVYRHRVHLGFLAAIVAAANAGGTGSVVGDTTTTMMWLEGVSPLQVLHAYVGAVAAFVVLAIIAARRQQRFAPIEKDAVDVALDWPRLVIVGAILVCAISANVYANTLPEDRAGAFPYVGATVLGVILFLTPWRRPDWSVLPAAVKSSVFLLSLVLAASMMPVDELPAASAPTTFGLGFVSAVFDNIPLTRLALEQGGYDWGTLAYAVGFGGSMLWFGSSAGVAVSSLFPEAKSAAQWLRQGWHVAVGYVVGFVVLLLVMGWSPAPAHQDEQRQHPVEGHRDGALAPEVAAIHVDVHRQARRHHHEVEKGEHSQRLRATRMGAREQAATHARVPGHRGHEHEYPDLRGQQQWIGQQSRVPGVHVGQPAGLEQQGFELPDDARGEQRHASPEQPGRLAGARGGHANIPARCRYQSLWKIPSGSCARLAARKARIAGCAASTCEALA
jgi:Na+/H+ antiporter NhaD/arsenite permease-like protein